MGMEVGNICKIIKFALGYHGVFKNSDAMSYNPNRPLTQ